MAPHHFPRALERLIRDEGCSIVLVDDPRGAEEMLVDYARRYPETEFIVSDTSLEDAPANVHPFGTNIEGWNYLTGIIAGAVTRSGMIGYAAPSDNPWDIEYANEFALGVRETGTAARILHITGEDTAEAVRTLAEAGCDVLNDVVRDAEVLLELEKLREEGMPMTGFSTSVPHEAFPVFIAAGSPLDMGFVFRSMIEAVLTARGGGRDPDRPAWFSVRNGALRIGGGDPVLAPAVEEAMRARTVTLPGRGRMSAYDFLLLRHRGLSEGSYTLPERGTVRLSPEIEVYVTE
jgi:basic membrane lipoprotein Med (substrate-binding protein (PBP1-ABC) superfamily)